MIATDIIKIRIIGCGCSLCEKLEKNAKIAAERLGIKYKLQKICNQATKMTPILFIQDKMICAGEVLPVNEIEDNLEGFLFQPNNK